MLLKFNQSLDKIKNVLILTSFKPLLKLNETGIEKTHVRVWFFISIKLTDLLDSYIECLIGFTHLVHTARGTGHIVDSCCSLYSYSSSKKNSMAGHTTGGNTVYIANRPVMHRTKVENLLERYFQDYKLPLAH